MIFEYRSPFFVMFFKPSIQSISLSFLFLAEIFDRDHFTNSYRAEEPSLHLFADYFSDKSSIDQKEFGKTTTMHDRSVHLHDRFLLRRAPMQLDQRHVCPPWRHTQIPVELFDLMTFVDLVSVSLGILKKIFFVEHHHLCPFVFIVFTTKSYNSTNS